MTKKTRYFLILIGFTVFLILAPIAVLYLRGLSINFETGQLNQTGIIAFSLELNDSDVYLNGELKRSGSGDIKFLKPGEYEITVKHPDYQEWHKRLTVYPGQVTWLNPEGGKIRMFLVEPKQQTLGSNISDFVVKGNTVTYLQNQNAVVSSLKNPETAKNYPLPKAVDKIFKYDEAENNYIFSSKSGNLLFFDADSGKILDLNKQFKTPTDLQISAGTLYVLNNTTLGSFDTTKQTFKPILENITAFYASGGTIYALQNNAQGLNLIVLQEGSAEPQTLITKLPEMKAAKIFVTFDKQIFILNQGNLYLASAGMKPLAQNVQDFNFQTQNVFVPISQSGELSYYNTLDKNLSFVTRSSREIKNANVLNSVSYALYISQNNVYAIELDSRGNQNSYPLYVGNDVTSMYVDDAGKNVVVLDNGDLKKLQVR